MAIASTVTTLDGFFKAVYGEKHINAVPENLYLVKNVDFREAEKIGKDYEVPVILSREHGVTYLAAGDGVTTLNDSVAAVSKNCVVPGSQIILRGQIDYEAAAKASTSKAAFMNTSELLVQNLIDSASNRLEIAFLYGASAGGLGIGDSSSNVDATHTVVTFTTASWAIGIWSGMEGAQLHFYKVSDDTLISSSTDAVFTIDSVSPDNRTLTLSGTATGISALDTALASTGQGYAHFKGAKTKECTGLDKIMTNTGSLFGISATDYSLWKANTYSAGSAALTMAKVLSAVSKAVARGLKGDAVCLVNPATWNNLNANEAALRKYDGSYSSSKAESGFEGIVYHGQNGRIEVVSHAMVKEGEAFILSKKRLKRVGAQDLSFKTPGRQDEIFLHIPDKNAYELRIYGNQAIFCEKPAEMVKITGIVNS